MFTDLLHSIPLGPEGLANAIGALAAACCMGSLAAKKQSNLQLLNIAGSLLFALAQLILSAPIGAGLSAILAFTSMAYWIKSPAHKTALTAALAAGMLAIIANQALTAWPGFAKWAAPSAAGLFSLWGFSMKEGLAQRGVIGVANTLWLISSVLISLHTQTLTCLLAYIALLVGAWRAMQPKSRAFAG